jgi:MOSC domain-containing protein YiiM
VALLVRRPRNGERDLPEEAEIHVDVGMVGDNWSTRPSRRTTDGGPDPDAQITLVNARAIALLAGEQCRWALAGDQVYVDFDLSETNVPAGTRLAIGGAVLEITAKPHNGCAKFRHHFGEDAVRFVNSPAGKQLHLRGVNAKVVRSGVARVGDAIEKLTE